MKIVKLPFHRALLHFLRQTLDVRPAASFLREDVKQRLAVQVRVLAVADHILKSVDRH